MTPVLNPVLPAAPLAATGVTAYVFALMGLIYLTLWWRDREAGMASLGLAALAAALFYAADAMGLNLPRGPHFNPPNWASLVLQVAIVAWALGLARYLGLRPGWRQPLVPLLLLPNIALGFLHLAQLPLPMPRLWGNVAMTVVFLGMAGLAWRARLREPGAGHGLIALAIVSMPLSSWLLALTQSQAVYLRYLAIPAFLLFFLVLLTVSLLRRRLALEVEVARRRAAEEALHELNATLEARIAQRTADLDEMVAGLESFNRSISHDLRGPLGGMEGLAQMGRDSLNQGHTDSARRMFGAIELQARHSHQLVASLLDLAHVGDGELHRAPVALGPLVREVIDQCRQNGGVPEKTEFVLRSLPTVLADANLLRPVLLNLVGNACKFSGQRTAPRVEIGSTRSGQALTVFVRDNGAGLDAATADELFQPFKRQHGNRFQGHGVGLSIVRRAVERHGGKVWAEGAPGAGATFYFTLPDALMPSDSALPPAQTTAPAEPAGSLGH